MTDEPWGAGSDSPIDEGSENTAVGPGSAGDQRTGENDSAPGRRENKGSDKQPWGKDEERYGETAEQGGQPNLGVDPATSDRPGRRPPDAANEGTALGDNA